MFVSHSSTTGTSSDEKRQCRLKEVYPSQNRDIAVRLEGRDSGKSWEQADENRNTGAKEKVRALWSCTVG